MEMSYGASHCSLPLFEPSSTLFLAANDNHVSDGTVTIVGMILTSDQSAGAADHAIQLGNILEIV